MFDRLNRTIDYLRVSITDRCNFRCTYCMPPEGVKQLHHRDILSYEELLRVIGVLSRHGIRKIRITGGEPLVRKGVAGFIKQIAAIPGITDLSLTTNGSLLAGMAGELKAAGLNRVNISLDTVDPGKFAAITGAAKLDATLKGIRAALAAGLTPLKLNVVLTEMFGETDLAYFIEQVYRYPIAVRFIEYMPIGNSRIGPGFSSDKVKEMINKAGGGCLEPVPGPPGNGPAKYFLLPKAQGTFGFITPISDHFCHACNRLRLTADGRFKPCLLGNAEIDIRNALRAGARDEDIAHLFFRAVSEKPDSHNLRRSAGRPEFRRKMSQIGG
ncbi:MAG: GTP 3',8-cyclase MoaA [Negativicutes bacterium]|nr:GTP 3',8-cyclase MoaA [Negativicutes bacterium]